MSKSGFRQRFKVLKRSSLETLNHLFSKKVSDHFSCIHFTKNKNFSRCKTKIKPKSCISTSDLIDSEGEHMPFIPLVLRCGKVIQLLLPRHRIPDAISLTDFLLASSIPRINERNPTYSSKYNKPSPR
jgi:hypothetical protein